MIKAGLAGAALLVSMDGAAYAYTQSSVGMTGLDAPIVDFQPAASSFASYSQGGLSSIAYADIGTGALGVSAYSPAYNRIDSTAKIDETLTFTIAGATADTITPITFLIGLKGEMGGPMIGLEARYSFTQELGYYAPTYSRYLSLNAGTIEGDYLGTDCVTSGSASDLHAVCTVPVKGAVATVSVLTSLRAMTTVGPSADPSYVDYSHGSTLRLAAADNVSWTSPSGAFAISGVPEPATWAAMVLGFGFAGASLRRSRRAVAAGA